MPSHITELSIIVPTLNEEDYIAGLLKSIKNQNFDGNLEVIVVDGKSDDNTIQVIEPFKKDLDLTIESSDRSIGLQRNKGAAKAKYKHLLFLDADNIVPKRFLEKLQKKISHKENYLASCMILPSDGNALDFFVVYILYFFQFFHRIINPAISGACIMTTKSAHDSIGVFDPRINLGEDYDYGLRLAKKRIKHLFFYSPHVKTSVRRTREIGRMKLVLTWWKAVRCYHKHGPEYVNKHIDYTFGHYKKRKK